MKKQTIALSLTAAAVTAALTAGSTFAYRGDPNVMGPNGTEEQHQAMLQAIENKDFNAWKELHAGKGRIAEVITDEEKFSKFLEARQYKLEGNEEAATAIMQELGMGMGGGQQHRGNHGQAHNQYQQ